MLTKPAIAMLAFLSLLFFSAPTVWRPLTPTPLPFESFNTVSTQRPERLRGLNKVLHNMTKMGYESDYYLRIWLFQASQVPKDELDRVLQQASRGYNKTLIITVLNKAYTEKNGMLDLFLRSFRLGKGTKPLLDHLLLAAVDQTAYERCKLLGLHCYKLVTDGVDFSGEEFYMTGNFVTMMWRRTQFLGEVLQRGYSFIFTDTDVMWLRNPFLKLNQSSEIDIQFSCDGFNGRPEDESNPLNTGFFFVRSNNKSIALFDKWYDARNNSGGMKEQDVLLQMIKNGTLRERGIRTRYLDTRYFGGFCHDYRDFGRVTTMHANCCRTVRAKLMDLSLVLEDWKTYRNGSVVLHNPHKTCLIDSWDELKGH
ncbi:hypothetical protein QJS04_geneDACA008693 [Acorus gramineus]|uniref:Nucleotide-diphospho-sugar transferase domain-containing protein n=1 Tax=Acorus gramineus TaxID=55184 RepID=A0AAV9ABY5_ACOGR|nr:hypothetical protein QJS04_geneDACA008693 [Acorus gramineus]